MAYARIDFQLEGADDLIAHLIALQKGVRNQVLRTALQKGARPVWLAARRYIRKKTGELRKSIGTRMRHYRKGHVWVIVIGTRSRKSRQHPPGSFFKNFVRGYDPARYGHVVERGAKPHLIPIKRGRLAGRVIRHPGHPADSFMIRSWLSERARVMWAIKVALAEGIITYGSLGAGRYAVARQQQLLAARP